MVTILCGWLKGRAERKLRKDVRIFAMNLHY
jgi:hypothetical protein